MSKLILLTTMTVDGVITVSEWFVSEGEHDRAGREQFVDAAGMLMGRKTYEGLACYWPSQTGEWGDLLTPVAKFVAWRSLQGPLEWNADSAPARERPHRRAQVLGSSRCMGTGRAAVRVRREGPVGARRDEGVRLGVTLLRYEPKRESA